MKHLLPGLLLLISLLAGCGTDDHDHPDLHSGKQLYEYHCVGCHKEDGSGLFLKGVPANRDTDLSVWQIVHKVKKGTEDEGKMPVFVRMPRQEASQIALYLKEIGR